jgi:uncharacterized membrane protein
MIGKIMNWLLLAVFCLLAAMFSLTIGVTAFLGFLIIFLTKRLLSVPPVWLRLLPYVVMLAVVGGLFGMQKMIKKKGKPANCSDLSFTELVTKVPSLPPDLNAANSGEARVRRLREDIRQDIFQMRSHANQVLDAFTMISDARKAAHSTLAVEGLPLSSAADALERALKEQNISTLPAVRTRIKTLEDKAKEWMTKIEKIGPGDDLSEVRRSFDAEKLEFSLENAYSKTHDVQSALNSFLINKMDIPKIENSAHLEEDQKALVYEERVQFDFPGAEPKEFDLSDFAVYWEQLQAQVKDQPGIAIRPQLFIGYGGVAPYEIKNVRAVESVLTRKEKQVTLISRITVSPVLRETCPRYSLLPFESFDLRWPLPAPVRIRGKVEVAKSQPVLQASFTTETNPLARFSGLAIPLNSFFAASISFKPETITADGSLRHNLVPEQELSASSMYSRPVRVDLFSKNPLLRWSKVQEHKELFFPINALLAAAYLFVVAIWGEFTGKK